MLRSYESLRVRAATTIEFLILEFSKEQP